MTGKKSTDKTFGIYDKDGKFYIGDSEISISGNNITILLDNYKGSPVLWELMTSKIPDTEIYTSEDLENYTDILLKTNAIIDPTTGKVKSSVGEKYKYIIKPIYEEHLKPIKPVNRSLLKGLKNKIKSRKNRWGYRITFRIKNIKLHAQFLPSDPNSLIEMLHLRFNSYKAGNTGVRNEIIDISDELFRQGIVNKQGIKKIMLQL